MHKSSFPLGSSGLMYIRVRTEFNILPVEQRTTLGQTRRFHLILNMFKEKCQSSVPLANDVNQESLKPDTYPDLIPNLC